MASRTRGVTFIDETGKSWHSYKDWGLHLSSVSAPNPEPKMNFVEVTGSSNYIDLSDMFGEPIYNQRTLTFVFQVTNGAFGRYQRNATIAEALHGKKLKIIPDDEQSYYYIGRLNFNSWELELPLGVLTFTCICDPYKYNIQATNEAWKWDSFSFVDGIITDASNWFINGRATKRILGTNKIIYPEIYCSSRMQISMDSGPWYTFQAGTTKSYDMAIPRGEVWHDLTIEGNGTLSIMYRGVTF